MTLETDGPFIARLQEEGMKRGLRPRLLEFYQSLARIQAEAAGRIEEPKVHLDRDGVRARIEAGVPLLSSDELNLDFSLLQDIFIQVSTSFGNFPDFFGQLLEGLKVTGANFFLSRQRAKAWLERSQKPLAPDLRELRGYPIIAVAVQAALKPFLVAWAKVLVAFVSQERWRRKDCPICGGKPDFAFLDRERGSRWLLCSQCDTEWLFHRLQCPYCQSQNQNDLACYTDPEGIYRLYTCEQCHTYLKAIDLRATPAHLPLPLERILTLDMDKQGQEKGFMPGYLFPDPLEGPREDLVPEAGGGG